MKCRFTIWYIYYAFVLIHTALRSNFPGYRSCVQGIGGSEHLTRFRQYSVSSHVLIRGGFSSDSPNAGLHLVCTAIQGCLHMDIQVVHDKDSLFMFRRAFVQPFADFLCPADCPELFLGDYVLPSCHDSGTQRYC